MYDVEQFPGQAYLDILYNAPIRQAYPSEQQFFRNRPYVAGYAADDGGVVQNPYITKGLSPVAANETVRQALRSLPNEQRPDFELTPEQTATLGDYSPDPRDVKDTILARIITGDPSAQNITDAQRQAANQAVNQTYNYLGISNGNAWNPLGPLELLRQWKAGEN